MQFAISKSIGLPMYAITPQMIKDTMNTLGTMKDGQWLPNTSISTLAIELPRKPRDFEQSKELLQHIGANPQVSSLVAGSPHDPMTKREKLQTVAQLTKGELLAYEQGGHAVHISPQADDFSRDLF